MVFNQANALKIAAVSVAAPRYAGAFGAAIGIEVLSRYTWLAGIEIATGGAMAVLEGFALAFVLSEWRLLAPRSLHWWVLLVFVLSLALTLPLVALPYLLIEQNQQTISSLFADHFVYQVLWSFLVAGVPMLVIMAVGFADVDDYERQQNEAERQAQFKQAKSKIKQAALASEQPPKQGQLASEQNVSKPFSCESCSKAFASQKALNGHKAQCKKIATVQLNGKSGNDGS